MRLATKILAVSLTFIVVLTAVAGYVSVRRVQDDFNQYQQEFAQNFADLLNQQVVSAYQENGKPGVEQFLREVSEPNQGAIEVSFKVFDPTETSLIPSRLPIDSMLRGFGGDPIMVEGNDDQGARNLFIYVPVNLTSRQLAFLEFAVPLRSLDKQMRLRIWLTVAAIGTLALGSVLTAYITGVLWVIRPLQQLSNKTERIGKGDFGDPLIMDTNDELGELATALNRMCVELDLQKRRIAEDSQQRLAMMEQLRHSDRLQTVGRLAAGVGHELGTPLNVISGRAGLICSGRLDASQVQESARIIRTETERITGIVRQLLDFARPRPPQRKQVDLDEILRHTIQLLEPLADKQGIRVDPPSPPSDGQSRTAFADAGQLQQVFTNIIVNAIQAISAEGQPSPVLVGGERGAVDSTHRDLRSGPGAAAVPSHIEIELSRWPTEAASRPVDNGSEPATAQADPAWCVSIWDSGPGVPTELLPHIFEPFFTTKDVGVGTGLGLSIVHGIVQEHGGRIEVSNRESGGACFRVYLPRESR